MENTVSDSTRPLLKLDFPLYVLEKIITMRDLLYPCFRILVLNLYSTACYIDNTSTYVIHQYTLATRLQLGTCSIRICKMYVLYCTALH